LEVFSSLIGNRYSTVGVLFAFSMCIAASVTKRKLGLAARHDAITHDTRWNSGFDSMEFTHGKFERKLVVLVPRPAPSSTGTRYSTVSGSDGKAEKRDFIVRGRGPE
jgi:hypothetical protein